MISSLPMSKWAHIDLQNWIWDQENCQKIVCINSWQYENKQVCLLVSDFLLWYWGWQSLGASLPSFPCWILIPSPHFGRARKWPKHNFLHPKVWPPLKTQPAHLHKTTPCTRYNCLWPSTITFKPWIQTFFLHPPTHSKTIELPCTLPSGYGYGGNHDGDGSRDKHNHDEDGGDLVEDHDEYSSDDLIWW